jgi:hypothetical protein
MPIITPGFWVRVQDGQVTDVWDTLPPSDQDGWSPAVEVKPAIIPNREYQTDHYFDISVTPVQIIWNKSEYTVDDRKNSLISQIDRNFQTLVLEELRLHQDQSNNTTFNTTTIETARIHGELRKNKIKAANTHEDIDMLEE